MGNVDQVMFGLSWERQLPSLGEQSLWHSLNINPATCEEKPSYYDSFKIHLNSGKPSFYLGCVIDQRKVEMGSGPTCTHFLFCHHCPLTQMAPLPPWGGFSSPPRYSLQDIPFYLCL